MLVCTAVEADHDAVLALMLHLNPDDPPLTASTSHSMFSNTLRSNCCKIIVAVKDESVVGTCYLNVIPNLARDASPYAIIENFVTHPSARLQGIGNALMSNALKIAKDQG